MILGQIERFEEYFAWEQKNMLIKDKNIVCKC